MAHKTINTKIQVSKRKISTKIKNKSPKFGLIFFSMIFIYAGGLFCYDWPQLFEPVLISYLKISTESLEFLYTVATFPAGITGLLGGSLMAYFGIGTVGLISSTFVYIGSIFQSYGINSKEYLWLVVGRFLYGIGDGVLNSVQASVAGLWFSENNLSLVLTFNRFVTFSAGFIAAFVIPAVYIKKRNLNLIFFIYSLGAFTSVVATFTYFFMERKYEKIIKQEEKTGLKEEDIEMKKIMSYKANLMDFFKSNLLLKLVILDSSLLIALYYNFTNISTDMLINRYWLKYSEAKNIISILPILGLIFTPILSLLSNRIGKKGIMLFVSSLLFVTAFLILYLIPEKPTTFIILIPFVLLGLNYGLYNSIVWTCCILASPKQVVPLTAGVFVSSYSILTAVGPLLFGYITEKRDKESYGRALVWSIAFAVGVSVLSLVVMVMDLRGDKILHYEENNEKVKEVRNQWSKELYMRAIGNREVGIFSIGGNRLKEELIRSND